MNKILSFGLFFCVLFSTPLFAQKAKQAKGQESKEAKAPTLTRGQDETVPEEGK